MVALENKPCINLAGILSYTNTPSPWVGYPMLCLRTTWPDGPTRASSGYGSKRATELRHLPSMPQNNAAECYGHNILQQTIAACWHTTGCSLLVWARIGGMLRIHAHHATMFVVWAAFPLNQPRFRAVAPAAGVVAILICLRPLAHHKHHVLLLGVQAHPTAPARVMCTDRIVGVLILARCSDPFARTLPVVFLTKGLEAHEDLVVVMGNAVCCCNECRCGLSPP